MKPPSGFPFLYQLGHVPGEGFANGVIDLGGGLEVCQISTFHKIWSIHEGGLDNKGASFYEPSPIPEGFYILGCYSQSNNKKLFGWVLAGKDYEEDASNGALKNPIDYNLVWSSESFKIKKDGNGYFWLPVPPDGYRAAGLIITNSPEKPGLDRVRCVRSDLTDKCQTDALIWESSKHSNFQKIYSLRPSNRGTQAMGVNVGTFSCQNLSSLACLKNVKSNLSSMPNQSQIQALIQAYSPLIYMHPDEVYLPSSVKWFFTNGALLYHKGEESSPVKIEPTGSNLPQGCLKDDTYWLDLPIDEEAEETVKKGDLESTQIYLHHVGDWEHLTLRLSNFNGELESIFFSQHSGGTWVTAPQLEFQTGSNKAVTYASLNGHAMYAKPGLVLQGHVGSGIEISNTTTKSKMVLDTGTRYLLVAAESLQGSSSAAIVEPPWLNYKRKWGPKIDYAIAYEIKMVEKLLFFGILKTALRKLVIVLPNEVLGEEGPTGPKVKKNWDGDEL
ncbi:hypothetical protein HS088_TW12G00040 [Tripterygium wilfordii]|uniref:Vacuolar protein sorting-associated protein 62 n=1 Tax=Tripterygium wilfordii TaxID=458696 RepID=A0A7J7CXL3_TRIWF|nr:hypothetical protein HS088_TW12G00040 [Tripterygium wilfordii]